MQNKNKPTSSVRRFNPSKHLVEEGAHHVEVAEVEEDIKEWRRRITKGGGGGGRSGGGYKGGGGGGRRGGGGRKMPSFDPSKFINTNPVDVVEEPYKATHGFETLVLTQHS